LNGYDVKALGEVIAKALGLISGDDIEVQRDLLNPNRILVLRHPQEQA